MRIPATAKCRCGHVGKYHDRNVFPDHYKADSFCGGCGRWHDFEMDNLDYIEQLAKQKGLV